MPIDIKKLKVASKDHPIYTGKYQSYSVKSKPITQKEIKKTIKSKTNK